MRARHWVRCLIHVTDSLGIWCSHLVGFADVVTNLLPSCCVDAVSQNAVPVILALMQSCNRSQPHLELVKYGLNVLRNLAACPATCRSVFEPDNLLDVLVELMQIYRDKEDIFLKAVTLLRIGSKLRGYVRVSCHWPVFIPI